MVVKIDEPLQHVGKNFVGIDFGTTNSLIGFFKDGAVRLVPDSRGNYVLPSIFAYNGTNVLVGEEAKACKDSISSVKRLLGKNLESFKTLYPLLKVSDASNISVNIGGKDVNVIEIASYIFRNLKSRAEEYSKSVITNAVVTVPAYFDDSSRSAIKNAAKLAGISKVRLLSEPTAAALFYGMDKKKRHGKYLVYDLGGGTFDVSILDFHDGIFKVITTDGDDILGGDDFDKIIFDFFKKKYNFDDVKDEKFTELMLLCRKIKEDLSQTTSARGNIKIGDNYYRFVLDIKQFNNLISSHINKTVDILLRALKKSGNTPQDIEGVLLVGGSTRINLIREKLCEIFDSRKILTDLNPDNIVVSGAALYASFINGDNADRMLLLDVLPLSLGIETIGGATERIILKDSPIPVSQSQIFTNFVDGQTSFKINIVQGEREFAKDNRSLAEFEFKNIPSLPAGKARIEVTFSVDENGILTVSAKELTVGVVQTVEVNPTYGLSQEKVNKMLVDFFEHMDADRNARVILDAKNYAEKVLEIIQNALKINGDLLDNTTRKVIEEKISVLQYLLCGEDYNAINNAVEKLENASKDFLHKRLNFLLSTMNLNIL